ncbi:MAG: lamin tail domain-containing protein, partial [Bacteroidetes bacterium]|nr:lamin tail domain-containing protein [Bacteroidota bacterium]
MKRFTLFYLFAVFAIAAFSQNAWINEIHYDNASTDVDEMIEVVIENAGSYNLADFQVDLYNGSGGVVYDTKTVDMFTVGATSNNFTIYYYIYPVNGIQNGAPDGMALSYQGVLISGQFLSYEGSFTATAGPANGVTSVDIGVSETSSTPAGESLQLTGTGTQYADFLWTGPVTATAGQLNSGQTFGGSVLPEPTNYPTAFTANAMGVTVDLSWTDATGAQLPSAYLILGSDQDNIALPTDGTPVADDEDLSDGTGAKNVLFGTQAYTFADLQPNSTYYFKIFPYTNAGSNIDYKTDGTPPADNATTSTVVMYEDFNQSWGAWTAISVTGDQVWDRDNTYGIGGTACARISGYSGGSNENEDWLISPPMNLDAYTNEILTFYNAKNYDGPDMQVKISTNYNGGGNPASATWTTLAYTLSPGSWTWTASGNIDLSTYSGTAVYLAFIYTSNTTESATWEVENVMVSGDGPAPADIVINEIMYNSSGDDEEWIELYNNTASTVDLSGWFIRDDDPNHAPITIPGGTMLAANDYFTIAVSTSGNFPFTPDLDGTSQITWSLGNSGDEVNLYNLGRIQADFVAFDDESPWPTEPDGNGPSLSLLLPSLDNTLPENWAPSIQTGGSPDAENFPPDPTVHVLSPNGGEIFEIGSSYDITWEELYGYTGNIQIELVDVGTGNSQLLVYNLSSTLGTWTWFINTGIAPGNDYVIEISDLSGAPSDVSDNVFAIVEPYIPAQIVITEIMYNPPESNVDSLEFIELLNNDTQAVNLLDYSFAEGVTFTFPDVILNPGDYFVVCVDSMAFYNMFGMSAWQWTGGALSNSGEDIILVDANGMLVDSVNYDDALPWDTIADGYGPSLTFCNPNLNNALAENWSASTEFAGVNAVGDSIFATPFAGCNFILPVAYFTADDTTIAVGSPAMFSDLSLGNPTAWEWTFDGGEPSSSNLQSPPPVYYNLPGSYNVSLTVTNENGDNTLL